MEYIKDANNKMIGSITTEGNRTIVKDFSGRIVSTYNADTNRTTDWKTNKTMQNDQSLRFVK